MSRIQLDSIRYNDIVFYRKLNEDEQQDIELRILETNARTEKEFEAIRRDIIKAYKREFFRKKHYERSLYSPIPGHERLYYIDRITYPEQEEEEEEQKINYSLTPFVLAFIKLRAAQIMLAIQRMIEQERQERYNNRLGARIRFMIQSRLKSYGKMLSY